jgi:hypothetical protein
MQVRQTLGPVSHVEQGDVQPTQANPSLNTPIGHSSTHLLLYKNNFESKQEVQVVLLPVHPLQGDKQF